VAALRVAQKHGGVACESAEQRNALHPLVQRPQRGLGDRPPQRCAQQVVPVANPAPLPLHHFVGGELARLRQAAQKELQFVFDLPTLSLFGVLANFILAKGLLLALAGRICCYCCCFNFGFCFCCPSFQLPQCWLRGQSCRPLE